MGYPKILPMHTLTILGHPETNSFNGALAQTYHEAASSHGSAELIEVAKLNFDPILRRGYAEQQSLEPDLVKSQTAIERASHVTFVFPLWWGSVPAALKGFLDRTFLPGWAFKYENNRPVSLLKGRSARIIMTADAPGWYDRLWYGCSGRNAVSHATLRYVGFAPVQITSFYGVRSSTAVERERWLNRAASLAASDVSRRASL